MIRVEPGSTPGIGITITENFFFGLFCLLWDVFFFAFCKGNWSYVILLLQRCWKDFTIYLYYRYLVLGTTYYIKSDNVDEDYGHIGGTSSFRPPGHRYATYFTIGID